MPADCNWAVQGTGAIGQGTMENYENNAVIRYCEDVASDLFIIRVISDGGGIPAFEAGQYAELAIIPERRSDAAPQKIVRRAYSIASAATEREYLEFYIAYVKDGFFTPQLQKLGVGSRLWLGPKIKGKFTLNDAPTGRTIVMAATGTGIAPFISMLRTYQTDPPWDKVVLMHGVRYAADLGYRSELETLVRLNPTFTYIPIVSREPEKSDWRGLRGRVLDLLEPGVFYEVAGCALDPACCNFFLCGNPAMIDAATEKLQAMHFAVHSRKEPGNIHFERYW